MISKVPSTRTEKCVLRYIQHVMFVSGRRDLPVVPAGGSSSVSGANYAGQDGPVVAGGPLARVGRCLHLFMTFWNR